MHFNGAVFDAHCDTIDKWLQGDENCEFSFQEASGYERFIQGMAVWIDKGHVKAPFRYAQNAIALLDRRRGEIPLLKTRGDLLRKGTSVLLCVEGGEAIEGKLSNLDLLFQSGVRMMTLTWNYQNEIGVPAILAENKGLTPFGFEVVSEMERLSMAVDVSHLSEKGFYDVIRVAKKPLIASHSCAKEVCPHFRNLTDAQFEALCENRGIVGINFYPEFLGGDTIDDILRHIDHFLARGGETHIGLGSDFDGVDCLPQDICGTRDMYKIADALLKGNLKEEIVQNIMFRNMERYFETVLPSR